MRAKMRKALDGLRFVAGLTPDERRALQRLSRYSVDESLAATRSPTISSSAMISPLASLRFTERVEIGPKASIGPFCSVWGGWSNTWARVGAGALLSPGSTLVAGNHRLDGLGWIRDNGFEELDVVIGDGAWLGAHATVVGCRVGEGAVVGAGAVVLEDVPDHGIAVGVPARVVATRSADA